MSESRDYYRVLGIDKNATPAQIKRAFRQLARQYHPDLNPNDPNAAATFKQIREAYEVLSHRAQRAHYDQQTPPSTADHGSDRTRDRTPDRTDYQTCYIEGVHKMAEQNYPGAIDAFTQAIQLNAQSSEAYLGRCRARYALGDDRGALDDCQQILQLKPNTAQAYFYQGRARARLGYMQSVITAYSRAIDLDPEYAQAYYHRGLIKNDLNEFHAATEDLKTAADLFKVQGDMSAYQRAEAKRKAIQGHFNLLTQGLLSAVGKVVIGAVTAIPQFLFNPGGGLLPAFARLSAYQAIWAGVIFAAIANFCLLTSLRFYWPQGLDFYLWQLILLGWVAFGSLAIASAITRVLNRSRGSWSGDLFLAGAALLPLAIFALGSGLAMQAGLGGLITLAIFTGSYTLLLLYSGCTQILSLLEQNAALAAPLILIGSGGVTTLLALKLLA